jgi:hypothetical protein
VRILAYPAYSIKVQQCGRGALILGYRRISRRVYASRRPSHSWHLVLRGMTTMGITQCPLCAVLSMTTIATTNSNPFNPAFQDFRVAVFSPAVVVSETGPSFHICRMSAIESQPSVSIYPISRTDQLHNAGTINVVFSPFHTPNTRSSCSHLLRPSPPVASDASSGTTSFSSVLRVVLTPRYLQGVWVCSIGL